MILSHKNKFLFIRNPKTASEAISDYVKSPSEPNMKYPFIGHITAIELRLLFKENEWDWDAYFKFVFVRNPWDRLVSLYFYGKPDKNLLYFWDGGDYSKKKTIPFEDWIMSLNTTNTVYDRKSPEYKTLTPWLNQHTYFCGSNGEIIVDYIGRYETLEKDLDFISKKIGVSNKLHKKNSTVHAPYRQYYSAVTRDKVANLFCADIEKFQYRF